MQKKILPPVIPNKMAVTRSVVSWTVLGAEILTYINVSYYSLGESPEKDAPLR